jgi:hypothetical protein
MNKEQLRMQMLAGIITESQYKAKLNEDESIKPKEITVKINPSKNTNYRTWREGEITLDTREFVYVGNDILPGGKGMKMIYFAIYAPKQNQIELYVGEDKNSLKFQTEYKFDSFEIGSKDDRDMFEITSTK